MKHDLRCKGTKTNQDLLDEYFRTNACWCPYMLSCDCWKEKNVRDKLILKELGKEMIEKERVTRRMNGLAIRTNKLEKQLKSVAIAFVVYAVFITGMIIHLT